MEELYKQIKDSSDKTEIDKIINEVKAMTKFNVEKLRKALRDSK